MTDITGSNRDAAEISVVESTLARSSIIDAAQSLAPYHVARLKSARCIFVPEGGRGHYRGPLFYGTTPELLRFLEDNDFPAELPVADQEYKELALHADTTWLGVLLVNHEDAIALVRLIAHWLAQRFAKRTKPGHIDVTLAVESGDATKRIHFKGPAVDFEETMRVAVEGLNDVDSP